VPLMEGAHRRHKAEREPPARTSEVAFRNSSREVITSTFPSRGCLDDGGQRRARSLRQAYGRARSSLPARDHKSAGEVDPSVVTAKLGRVQHLAVTFDRGQVPARDRACERRGRSEPADVVEGTSGKGQEGLQRQTDCRGHALYLAEQCHEMVRCHASCSVVRGPCLRRYHERLATERVDEVDDGWSPATAK